MKNFIKTLFLILFSNLCIAQGGWQWAVKQGDAAGGEYINSIQTDQWGNIYVSGIVYDLYVRDSAGNIQYDSNFLPILYNYGNKDIWVGKYNPDGKNLWHNYAGSGSSDLSAGFQVDKNGNSYIVGVLSTNLVRPVHTFSNTPISNDSVETFIAKLDSSGNLLWHKPYGFDTLSNRHILLGWGVPNLDKNDKLNILISTDRDVVLFNQDTIFSGMYIARFDQNGNYLDVKRYPFKNYFNLPSNFSWDMDDNGNSYFIGAFQRDFLIIGNDTLFKDTANFVNTYVLAFDSLAQYKWGYLSSKNYYDQAYDGAVFGDTIFAAINFTSSFVDSVYFDTQKYKTGTNTSQESALLLLDANTGNVIGLRHNTGTYAMTSWNFSTGVNKDFMAVGGRFNEKMTYSGTTDYMESVDKSGLGNSDNFFALFDRQGNYLCEDLLYTLGAYDGITNFTFIDSSVIVAGFFNDTLFVAGDTLIARGKNDVFIARYDLPCNKKIPVGIKNNFIKAEKGVLIYPNPAKGFTNLIGKPINNIAQLIDMNGKVVQTFQLHENLMQQQLHFKEHKAGVYFITIVGKGDKQVLKVVIE